ncbi:hypothetical protein EGJ52_21840 [Pseudomonas luteola]|uniref:hypothetical protein n=1 Tax=Pseudomonas luteola TaxID=47886 RepID=UPI000F76AC19|nr:hypothetical protein [Pseudomonas luteola]RRW40428.1 hypothetical protein EGJ52_21840 [Pseudomonas luteola]
MKIYGNDKSELMAVSQIERDGDELVIKGKIFSAMPMTARLRPEEARAALKLLNWKTLFFLLTLPFRPRVGKVKASKPARA